jgi:hypothetical protein
MPWNTRDPGYALLRPPASHSPALSIGIRIYMASALPAPVGRARTHVLFMLEVPRTSNRHGPDSLLSDGEQPLRQRRTAPAVKPLMKLRWRTKKRSKGGRITIAIPAKVSPWSVA